MELTYKGRASALLSFYKSLVKNNIYVGRSATEWGSGGIPPFDPTGMIYTGGDAPESLSSYATISMTFKAVKPDVNGSIVYNGGKYTEVATLNNSSVISDIITGSNNDTLLYITISITPNSGVNKTFRQVGFIDSDNNILLYQNIPAQSIVGGSGDLNLTLILAF